MKAKFNAVFEACYFSKAQVVVQQGGTWSGKTFGILQCLLTIAVEQPKQVITIAGQDMPNLKAGAIRDFETILSENPQFVPHILKQNKTDHIYYFKNGTQIEFKSYENFQDAKSGKRHYLFINEANGFSYEVAEQLILRTSKRVFIDFNPDSEFWVHEQYKNNPIAEFFISDHRHNANVPDAIRAKIESLKDKDIELWRVYARGMTGKIEGLIYRNWEIVDHWIEKDIVGRAYGLDFGFNHPTALVEVCWTEDDFFVRELVYESGLITSELINRMRALDLRHDVTIYADSARPDAIEEIQQAGFNIEQADKSVKDGINSVKAKRLRLYQSPNLVKELRAYRWKTDKNGKPIDEPVKVNDDGADAMRYAIFNGTRQTILDYDF